MNAADFGNYHAGFTGTRASIGEHLQKQGAGVVEILKNKTYSMFLNPKTYFTAPFGDNPNDYRWNTTGMKDANSVIKRMPYNKQYLRGSHISKAIHYGNW